MNRPTALFGATLLTCAVFAFPMQDSKPVTRPDDSAKKIESLAKALDAEKRHSADLERRIDRLESAMVSLRTAAERLDSAANDARKNGFEQAGPNPLAHTNLLDGLKGFAALITSPTAEPTPPR